jgi:hypothetical protein
MTTPYLELLAADRGREVRREAAAALALVDDVGAPVGLLTETAADYFPRHGFTAVDRDPLPAALTASAELRLPASAHALLRPVTYATEGR